MRMVMVAGRLGLEEYVEPRVRRVVADRLGIDETELVRGVSLADDLAADSLDLLEVVICLEGELGIAISERRLELVRTMGDLVDTVVTVLANERQAMRGAAAEVSMRVVPDDGMPQRAVARSGVLTPYIAQTITDDVLRAGPGARLEVNVRGDATPRVLSRVRGFFAGLSARGIAVSVRPDPSATSRSRAA
jgi:acyl carrier protein